MPLFTTNITLEERRDLVRQLCRITSKSYNDAELDAKMDIGDVEAKAWLQTTTTTDELIIISNYITARNILTGIGGDRNLRAAQEYTTNVKNLVKATNNKADGQNAPDTLLSSGIAKTGLSGQSGTF